MRAIAKSGNITITGSVTEYRIPTANSVPVGITAGPDRTIWFSEDNSDNIAEFKIRRH